MSGPEIQKAGSYRDRNATADRAIAILELFSDDKLVWSGLEIAERLGVARSTGYRYLKGLAGAGFVEECGGGFRLGSRVLELARLARKGIGLSQIARPIMRSLADEVGETVILTRRSGAFAVCLELEECHQPIRISYERGHVLPINAGASAQILFAWTPPGEVESLLAGAPLRAFTERSIVTVDKMHDRLAEIRARDYATSIEELDRGVTGIAAPVRATDEQPRAGLSVAALASRIPKSRTAAVVDAVREAAGQISNQLPLYDI